MEGKAKKVLVHTFMYRHELKTGVYRIDTRFGSYLPYPKYPKFLEGVNQARAEIYGEEAAKQFRVSNDPIPATYDDIVYCVRIDASTGNILSKTPMTPAEATAELQKLESQQIRRKGDRETGNANSEMITPQNGEEFGTSMADVLNGAAAQAEVKTRRGSKAATG